MLRSFAQNVDEIREILRSKDQNRYLLKVYMFVVADLIQFLEPFEDVTKQLEADHWPTLHKVFLCFFKLQRFMSPSPADSCLLKFLKKEGWHA